MWSSLVRGLRSSRPEPQSSPVSASPPGPSTSNSPKTRSVPAPLTLTLRRNATQPPAWNASSPPPSATTALSGSILFTAPSPSNASPPPLPTSFSGPHSLHSRAKSEVCLTQSTSKRHSTSSFTFSPLPPTMILPRVDTAPAGPGWEPRTRSANPSTRPSTSTAAAAASPLSRLPLSLVGRRAETPQVLTLPIAHALRSFLPAMQRTSTAWKLQYSLDQHGISLASLHRHVERSGPCILVIADEANHVFGAFLSEPPTPQAHYFGSGECFLWRLTPGTKGATDEGVEVFPWTGLNDYCILSEPHFLAVGGGEGRFGLWIDGELERGHTAACSTFGNPELVPGEEGYGTFACEGLEVWTFQ